MRLVVVDNSKHDVIGKCDIVAFMKVKWINRK